MLYTGCSQKEKQQKQKAEKKIKDNKKFLILAQREAG